MAYKPREISLDEYDEVADEFEIRASREDYERESANLLQKISERDELVKLLKLARPDRLDAIKQNIKRLDKYIEGTEVIVEKSLEVYETRIEYWKEMTILHEMSEIIKPELLAHVAKHNPEKLEELEAMLSDDDRTH